MTDEAQGVEVPEKEIRTMLSYATDKMKRDRNPVDRYEEYVERIRDWLEARKALGLDAREVGDA